MHEDIKYLPFTGGNSNPFCVSMAGISYCDGSYRIARDNSDISVFEYVMEGTGTVQYNGRVYTASAGDVYIIRRGSSHVYFSDGVNPWTKIWFNIYGPLVDAIASAYGLDGKVVISGCGEDILSLFRQFNKTVRSGLSPEEIFRRCAIIYHDIVSRLSIYLSDARPGRQSEAYAIKNLLDSGIEKNITLSYIAKSIFRSEAYTIAVFKKEFGITPYRYLLREKMEAAKSLLSNSTLPVKDISVMLGYEDQHYFSGLFRQYVGMCPKRYREARRLATEPDKN